MKPKGKTKKGVAFEEGPMENLDQKGYSESIISSMTDSLIVVNPDATLRSMNKATLDLLGYEESELIGQPVNKILLQEEGGGEEGSVLHKYFKKIIAGGIAHNIGLTLLTKQHHAIPVNFSGAVLHQDNRIIGIVGVARDMRQIMTIISDLENKERELEKRSGDLTRMRRAMLHMMGDLDIANKEMEKSNKELRNLDRLRSDFVSTVSHELRTPITVTREAISQVLDGLCGEINREQEEFLFMSIEGIDRLARLIDNLLELSKIEAHKIELKRELIDVVSLAKEVSSSFAVAFQSKGLETRYNFPKDRIELWADKDRITQVFVNLVSNSLRFTPAGYVEISVVDKENVIECAVSDTGIGISDEDLPRVFSKFEQFGREFESAEKGTGLGLAISKGIIELHRGIIWVESKLGQGTKISFALPKYSPKELFKEYVTDGLAEAIKESASLSTIIFEVKNYDALKEKLGQDKIASIINGLGRLIKTELRRKSGISIENSRAILVALSGTNKKAVWTTAERLKSAFNDHLSKEGLAEVIEVDIRLASFPEDTNIEEELIDRV